MGAGYGREVVLDHGHDFLTVYGHLSAIAVLPGTACDPRTSDRLRWPVGTRHWSAPSLRGPRHNVPVNPHKYLRRPMSRLHLPTSNLTASPGK